MGESKQEVMVCKNGLKWELKLRQPCTVVHLPGTYSTEQDAVTAAYKFIHDRRKSHPYEQWFCLHPKH